MRTKKKNEKVAYHTLHFICSLTKALRPKEKMSVSDWADKHMVEVIRLANLEVIPFRTKKK
jgi:hypothetical protein